jgi:hypothetical protein
VRIVVRSDPDRVDWAGEKLERARDRREQAETMLAFLSAFGGDAIDLGDGYRIDYAVVGEGAPDRVCYRALRRVAAHVEIKRRYVSASTYPTVFLEESKRTALLVATDRLRGHGIFVVRYDDGIRWVDVARTIGLPVIRAGRVDRGLREDIDPCVDVPVELLRRIP